MLTYAIRNVQHVDYPHTANCKPILGANVDGVAIVAKLEFSGVIDSHNSIACVIYVGETLP